MFEIGKYTTLKVDRFQTPGAFLINENEDDILLPNKYVSSDLKIGDEIKVFIYLDGEERPVATTIDPAIQLNDYAVLKANSVSKIGAFMDWGLEKDLFIPFREQLSKIQEGKKYLVHLLMDNQTNRLFGTTKLDKYLNDEEVTLQLKEEVDLIIWTSSDLGTKVIINKKYHGLLFSNEIFQELELGQQIKGYVKKIRPDGKIDVSLEKISYKNIEPNAKKILQLLEKSDGFISLNDHSDPDIIKSYLGISKKSFKKALGSLYKQRIILIEKKGIRLK